MYEIPLISMVQSPVPLDSFDIISVESPYGDKYAYLTIRVRIGTAKAAGILGAIVTALRLMGYW